MLFLDRAACISFSKSRGTRSEATVPYRFMGQLKSRSHGVVSTLLLSLLLLSVGPLNYALAESSILDTEPLTPHILTGPNSLNASARPPR